MLAVVVGFRASSIGGTASGDATAAIRGDAKRGSGIIEDATFLYAEDAPLAYAIAEAEFRAALGKLPASAPGVDQAMLDAIANGYPNHADPLLDQARVSAEDADRYGSRAGKITFSIALMAIAGSLLGLAALMGPDSGGRLARGTAVAALLAAVVWSATGFV